MAGNTLVINLDPEHFETTETDTRTVTARPGPGLATVSNFRGWVITDRDPVASRRSLNNHLTQVHRDPRHVVASTAALLIDNLAVGVVVFGDLLGDYDRGMSCKTVFQPPDALADEVVELAVIRHALLEGLRELKRKGNAKSLLIVCTADNTLGKIRQYELPDGRKRRFTKARYHQPGLLHDIMELSSEIAEMSVDLCLMLAHQHASIALSKAMADANATILT